jgi:RNA polymerase sigma factor (sigma-70 family)
MVCTTADAELLAKYAASRAAADFEPIVARHGPMVLRTCIRLTSNTSDAEDAAQATFVALSQRPTAAQPSLAGWLHKVARDCACQVLRERARRARREEAHARMRTNPTAHERDLREELDAALVRLPADLREAVVLRYLEGRDSEEAARLAGCNENTLRWRSMKGLDRLRNILAQREVLFSVSALTAFMMSEATATASTASLAALTATATGGVAETGRATLIAKKALNGFFWAKVKMCSVTVAAATTVAAASAPFVLSSSSPPPAPTTVTAPANPVQLGPLASLGGRRPFPHDSPWNQDISREPVDPNSDRLIASIGKNKTIYPDFGAIDKGVRAGVPYVVVSGEQPRVPIRFDGFPKESDPGPYPVPLDAPMEGGPDDNRESRRMIVVDRDNWKLYELTGASREGAGWRATGGAVFDLKTNAQRPLGWTSIDPAGLPVFAGLVRYDEVAEQKEIRHALRFSCRETRRAFVAPARHWSGSSNDPNMPPMGMRVRLKADVDIASFPPQATVVLKALKQYGMFLANHGSDWYLSGTPDPRWDVKDLKSLQRLKGSDFEVVKMGKIEMLK